MVERPQEAPGDQKPLGITSEPVTEQGETKTLVPSDSKIPPVGKEQPKPLFPPWMLIGVMFVIMYFLLFRGPRKKQRQHKQMVQSLQKNDRVRTIGGIIGPVVDIKDDEITLKVDESNNTKIKVASSAIGKNLLKDK